MPRIPWKAVFADVWQFCQGTLVAGCLGGLIVAAFTVWLSRPTERLEAQVDRLETVALETNKAVSGIGPRLDELSAASRTTNSRLGSIEGTIRQLHPNDQSVINDRLVLRAAATGIVATTQPLNVNGQWSVYLVLADRSSVSRWRIPVGGSADRRVADLVSRASENPDVAAVKLSMLAETRPADWVDPVNSFVARGTVQVCKDKFIDAFGPPTSEALPPLSHETGRGFVELLPKLAPEQALQKPST